MKTNRPLELPERLAVLLLEELSDIHALVQTIADMQITSLAKEIQSNEGVSERKALKLAADSFEELRQKRSANFLKTQLRRLKLPSVEIDNPSSKDE